MKALVVDDAKDIDYYISETLMEVEGMEVDQAHSRAEADAAEAANEYDLYIVDVYLAGLDKKPDGLEFVRNIRKSKPGAKIILMTGKSFSRILTDVLFKAGSAELLAKPVSLDTLLTTVRRVIGKK